ncbi:hypothetical protein LIER_37383 [Lithospermum erythrorhizon]|uniref:Uncharacterized protein n=1 Tax=Lithospermum erythrorhizon TaxID=34254 RepID=A0AAV3PJS6_LITER
MQVPPNVDDSGKSQNPSTDSLEKVGSTDTLLKYAVGGDEIDNPASRVDVGMNHPDKDGGNKEADLVERSGDVEDVNPNIKDTSDDKL